MWPLLSRMSLFPASPPFQSQSKNTLVLLTVCVWWPLTSVFTSLSLKTYLSGCFLFLPSVFISLLLQAYLFISSSQVIQLLFPISALQYLVVVVVLVTQLCLTLCNPMNWSSPGSSVHGILQAGIWSGLPFPSPGDLPDLGIEPGSPALQADSLPSELQGSP